MSLRTTFSGIRRTAADSRGQSVLELALLLPVLMLILVGAVDLGRIVQAQVVINNAARVGAQYASVQGLGDTSAIQSAVLAEVTQLQGVDGSNPGIAISSGLDNESMTKAIVTVTYRFSPVARIPALPSVYTLTNSSQMRIKP